MSRRRVLVLATGTSVLLALPAAADVKSWHGTACRASHNNFDPSPSGLLLNMAGQVYCGLIRDRTNNAGNIISVYIEAYNSTPTAITCSAITQGEDHTGTEPAQVLSSSSAASEARAGNVQIGPMKPTTTPGNEGSYFVTCALGAEDIFYHVYVNEKTTTD